MLTLYPQFKLQVGDTYRFRVSNSRSSVVGGDPNTWCTWLWWAGRWHRLSSTTLRYGVANARWEAYTEVQTNVEPAPRMDSLPVFRTRVS